jgi:hypothetical protein
MTLTKNLRPGIPFAHDDPMAGTALDWRRGHAPFFTSHHLLFLAQPGRSPVRSHYQQAIRRRSFKSIKALIAKINHFAQQYNRNSKRFARTATADSNFEKLSRLCSRFSGTQHVFYVVQLFGICLTGFAWGDPEIVFCSGTAEDHVMPEPISISLHRW